MATKGSTTRKGAGTARAGNAADLPPSARALAIDDLIDTLADPGDAPAPPPSADLDDLLAELSAPPPSLQSDAAMSDFDDLLGEIAGEPPAAPFAPAPDAQSSLSDFDDLLGELTDPAPAPVAAAAAPAPMDSALDDLDDLLGELVDATPAAPPAPVPQPATSKRSQRAPVPAVALPEPAAEHGPDAVPQDVAETSLAPSASHPRRFALRIPPVRYAVLGAVLLASNGLSYWVGTLRHTVVVPPRLTAPLKPVAQGTDRYIGEGLSFRIEGKTFLESDEMRAAVDELVGGPELQGRIGAMMERVKETGPVSRVGARLRISACNPASCGQENFVIQFDTANKTVTACLTQPYVDPATGDATAASSWMYNENGSREVPVCEGFPHPAPPVMPKSTLPSPTASADAESAAHQPDEEEE